MWYFYIQENRHDSNNYICRIGQDSLKQKIKRPPPNPTTIWNTAETAIAPDNSLIRTCQSSVRFSWDIWLRISGAGHCHCGRFSIARVGTKNDIVPPCTNGNLIWKKLFTSSDYCCCSPSENNISLSEISLCYFKYFKYSSYPII